ncbi:NAD(P)-binding protein [Glonium stellatum]|uniref:NAD(P)-binding protein n=1 Tax=Glonium stellatum TaxID=574774 RepID=A0A8E2ENS2_9PEZI|nr:NAD(P)-binding protein [Glonium stellatum]
MDAKVTIPKPKNISLAQAATLGVGADTACLGIFNGLNVPLFNPDNPSAAKDEWALVLGGASSVGNFAVQILKAAGYKVVATCSTNSFQLLKALGADASVDYKKSQPEVISELLSITNRNLTRAYDAVAMNNELITVLYDELKDVSPKYFTTTGDLSSLSIAPHFTSHSVLGPIGRPGNDKLNSDLNSFIRIIVKLVETGKLAPSEMLEMGSGNIDDPVEAWKL